MGVDPDYGTGCRSGEGGTGMRVGEVGGSGVHRETLRYYERRG